MFGFEIWLAPAMKGDRFAAQMTWHFLADAVRARHLSDREWELLGRLVDGIATAPTGKLATAANSHLRLGRRRGRSTQHAAEERHFRFAHELFLRHGMIRGKRLANAIDDLAAEMGIGWGDRCLANPEPFKKAYNSNLALFRELETLDREADAARASEESSPSARQPP